MIEVYTKNQTVLAGSALPLSNVSIDKGCDCKLVGSSTINLTRHGIYRVAVSVNAIANDGGDIALQLSRNDLTLAGAVATETAGDITSKHSLSFETLIEGTDSSSCANGCCKSPVSVQIVNTGVAITLANLNVSVTKVSTC